MLFRDDCGASCAMELSRGDAGTLETIAAMQEFVADAIADPRLQTLAAGLAAQAPRGDRVGQVRGVYDWLRSRVVFKGDPWTFEHLRHPARVLAEVMASPNGRTAMDCDDVAMMGATLVGLMGFAPKFIVTGRRLEGPYGHVFYGLGLPGGRVVPFDPQEGHPPGRWPPAARKKIFPALPPTA